MADEQEKQAERQAADHAKMLGEREKTRREIADLEQQRRDLDARLSERRAMLRSGTFDADTPFEVMVDSLGAMGEHVKGDILRPGDGPYDFAWLERSGSIRRLSADEVRLLEQRPMESMTRPLAADGSVDPLAQAGGIMATGATADPVEAEMLADEREAGREARAEDAGEAIREREHEGRTRRGR